MNALFEKRHLGAVVGCGNDRVGLDGIAHGQCTPHGANRAVEAELAKKAVVVEHRPVDLVDSAQDANGDREIEAGPALL